MAKKVKDSLDETTLTEKNKIFCREYIFDWNGSRAYKIAYPNVNDATARANASDLLTKTNIKDYITEIQKNLEELAGISRLKVISEHMKMAFSSIAHLHNTWIERKEFDSLTDDQKSCIEEISTKTHTEFEYEPEDPQNKKPITVEYVKVKLYSKQKSLEEINKMMSYYAPVKSEFSGIPQPLNVTVDSSETANILKALKDEFGKIN
jgi:phage terminase small subunit